MPASYADFIRSKRITDRPSGFEPGTVNPNLFDWQAQVVQWACRRGRFGGYEDCGLGKSIQELESARMVSEHTGRPCIIFAPLAVAAQTKREAAKFDIQADVTICRSGEDVRPGINIANYERLHLFDPAEFGGVILDEGSILKSLDGKTRGALLDEWTQVPYRQSWSATPSPNDYMELGNQAQFLGVMSRAEMLSTFFVHDGGETSKWRLKGHCRDLFWEWMASWCVMIRSPSDIGFSDDGYVLPEIKYTDHILPSKAQEGQLFATGATSLNDRRAAKRISMTERCDQAAAITAESDGPCVVWCGLNAEGERLAKVIPGSVEVAGRHSTEKKEEMLAAFTIGEIQTLITKPKIGGFGLNWQHCASTIVFPTDSFEQWYQMVRRFWRFGQERVVHVHTVATEEELPVVMNLRRKEREVMEMFDGIAAAMGELTKKVIGSVEREDDSYSPETQMEIPQWLR